MGHYEKTKPKNNRYRRRRKSSIKSTENIFNKIIEENFPNLKKDMPMKIQEAYRTPNRLDPKKSPLAHNNQNTKHTE